MKFTFRSLPFGYKILFIGMILTFLSMLLPWGTEIIRVSGQFRFRWAESPFRNGEFLILLPYLYHLGMMLTGRTMHRWVALVLVFVPVIGFFFLLPGFEPPYDFESGIGFSLFLVFSIIAVLGMLIGLKHTTKELSLPFKSGGNGQ